MVACGGGRLRRLLGFEAVVRVFRILLAHLLGAADDAERADGLLHCCRVDGRSEAAACVDAGL